MIGFLFTGLIRDNRRSLLPVIVVTIGVFFVVVLDGIVGGMMGNMVQMTARFQTGHVRVMSRAYSLEEDQIPNDLALLEADEVLEELNRDFPGMEWTPRIRFGGLLDIPDMQGETKAQGPVSGQAYDLLGTGSTEPGRLELSKAIVAGNIIRGRGEILVSVDFADKFNVVPGDTVTFFGTTMYGSMSFSNYAVAGIVRFGNNMLDRGAVILDLEDARLLLDMDDAAGEIVGYLPGGLYDRQQAELVKNTFNARYASDEDEYATVMKQLADQPMMGQTLDYAGSISFLIVVLLVVALSIVLWNTGVLGGIRRYNEFGVRLALGEEKRHIYGTLLLESLIIGIAGSLLGTMLGIGVCLLLGKYGLDYSRMMENISMMIDPVIRAEISPRMYFIGAIPGVLSMLLGTALAGRAIYKRKTAMLFKELD